MNVANSFDIAFVVMPPAHGKRRNCNVVPGLVSADQVVPLAGNLVLQNLKFRAQETKDWADFDEKWSSEIQHRLTVGRWVVMVPARSMGDKAGWKYLDTLRLDLAPWNWNLESKGKTIEDHEEIYLKSVKDRKKSIPTNHQLQQELLIMASQHL